VLKFVLILAALFHDPSTPVRVARFCAVEAGLRISDDYDIAKPVTLACIDRYHGDTCWRQVECEAFFGEECEPLEDCEQFHPDVARPSELGGSVSFLTAIPKSAPGARARPPLRDLRSLQPN
jgi:hypothetical protein